MTLSAALRKSWRRGFAVALIAGPHLALAQESTGDCLTRARARTPGAPLVIPIALRNNHVTLHVCHGDKPLLFVLDTGAGSSIFDLELARSLGVELGAPIQARGAGAGTVPGARVQRDSVTLPASGVTIPISLAIDFSGIRNATGNRMDGIVGADFISRYVVALDYRRSELRLYDRALFTYDGLGVVVPIRIIGAFIRAPGEVVLNDGTRLPGEFTIDVGSSLAVALAKPFVDQHRLRERVTPTIRRPTGRGVGGASVSDVGRVAGFSLGGAELKQPIVYLFGDSAGVFSGTSQGDGNIGGEILRRFTVYFDYKGLRMILEPHDGTSEPFEADMSGMQLRAMPGARSLLVEYVVPTSPAAEAALEKDDVVIAIDGAPITNGSLEAVRVRTRRAGERLALTVRRRGTEMLIRFETRRLL
jgi:S1-C subfamily serine protease